MNAKDGAFRQRVGHLIEQHICDEFNLFYNKRQRTQGYYDAYNKKDIYEIKASNIKNNVFIIRVNNHKQLVLADGSYIFISYNLKNKDKDLSVISDIKIKDIKIIKAKNVNIFKESFFMAFKSTPKKQYVKVYLSYIKKLEEYKL